LKFCSSKSIYITNIKERNILYYMIKIKRSHLADADNMPPDLNALLEFALLKNVIGEEVRELVREDER